MRRSPARRSITFGRPLAGGVGTDLAAVVNRVMCPPAADPEGNGLELMVDRPAADWPRKPDGSIAMTVAPFDGEALVTEAFSSASVQTQDPSP